MPREWEARKKETLTTMCKANLAAATMAAILPLVSTAYQTEPIVRDYGARNASKSAPVIRDLAPPPLPSAHGISPLGIGILPAVELPSQDWDVALVRLNVFVGCHREVYGLDAGVIGNETVGEFVGVQAAGFYNRIGYSEGALQFAGIMNRCAGDFAGLQTAVAANITDGTMSGFQFGLVNRAARLDGLQIGFFNIAETGSGVQIGVWNSAQSLEGLQIGIGNYNADSSMPFFPVVNFAF